MSLRVESYTTYTTRGSSLDSRLVDPDSSDDEINVDPETVKQVAKACLWGPVKRTDQKITRLVLWTGIGAGVGTIFEPGVGTGVGAIVGFGVGIRSLM